MATAQPSKSNNDRNKKNAPRAGSQDTRSAATGERDENYNLISVLYHALQAAETAQQYQQDAQKSGDQELAEFFEVARGGYIQFAEQAKQLLATRLEVDEEGDEEDEEEED